MTKNSSGKTKDTKESFKNTVQGKPIRKKDYFFTILIVGFIIVAIVVTPFLAMVYCESWLPLVVNAELFFIFFIIPLLGIAHFAVLIRSKKSKNVAESIVWIALLSIPVIISTWVLTRLTLSYIYTPPALTQENLAVFNKCIKFMKRHNEYKTWGFQHFPKYVFVNDEKYVVDVPASRHDLRELFSEDEIIELEKLVKSVFQIGYLRVERKDNVVLFYNGKNFILPGAPGVLYSLNGENPNEADFKVLNKNKPFIRINQNWYMSRKLVLSIYPRWKTSIPKSLIDHSLHIKGVDITNTAR